VIRSPTIHITCSLFPLARSGLPSCSVIDAFPRSSFPRIPSVPFSILPALPFRPLFVYVVVVVVVDFTFILFYSRLFIPSKFYYYDSSICSTLPCAAHGFTPIWFVWILLSARSTILPAHLLP